MIRILTAFCLTLFSITAGAQNPVRPLEQLINTEDPGWPLVQQWISSARNKVEVLPSDKEKAADALYRTQVTTRSPMGAIIYSTGGLLIDGGWIRILGSGSSRLNRSVPDWNAGKSFKNFGEPPSFLLVADDAAGGFFAINATALGNDPGKMYYLSPDDLQWTPLDLTYTEFLHFCFNNDLSEFYKGLRWKEWKTEVAALNGQMTYSFFPYLWTAEGKDINGVTRKTVPVEEHYHFLLDMRRQLGLSENGL